MGGFLLNLKAKYISKASFSLTKQKKPSKALNKRNRRNDLGTKVHRSFVPGNVSEVVKLSGTFKKYPAKM
jgi:hypothetical protein